VSDFGLTVNAYTATHKYVTDGPKPIRYLAPEALRKGRYSEKSDVWAFGVTVWEVLSGGDIPFFDITDDDAVVRHVVEGGVLPPPESPTALPLWAAQCSTVLCVASQGPPDVCAARGDSWERVWSTLGYADATTT
jgi:serine/threonine protein kinase